MQLSRNAAAAALAAAAVLWVNNSSLLADGVRGDPGVLAHRGVHQTFARENLDRHTCTASRMDPPTNPYLENTLPSMRASFAAGATALEIDVHPTSDGEFAVFHDWRLECRTNGEGVTRKRTAAYLKTLDVGYGYTADGGRTYPFRGKGVGMMPMLSEVFEAFPGRRFLINVKSNNRNEADRLVAYLKGRVSPIDGRTWIFADGRPFDRLTEIAPSARVMSKKSLKSCSSSYLAFGWTGWVPASCRGRFIAVPANLTALFWGWPNRFFERMAAADVEVMMVGPAGGDGGIALDDPRDLDAMPMNFPGYVITDKVELIAPAVRAISRKATGASRLGR